MSEEEPDVLFDNTQRMTTSGYGDRECADERMWTARTFLVSGLLRLERDRGQSERSVRMLLAGAMPTKTMTRAATSPP